MKQPIFPAARSKAVTRTLVVGLAASAIAAAAAPCESLTTLKLKNVAITSALALGAGAFTPPNPPGKGQQNPIFQSLPAFCRVAAALTPSSDSEIKIEVWMPAAGWNGNLQSVGNGAWAGSISYPAMAAALQAGYATASTDTGHAGNVATFVVGHPEKLIDFAYRAVHEMTVAAKAITAAHYGSGPKLSFWNGCSTGGRQALAEAQRYPADYDGIIAGAPANYPTRLQGAQVWTTQVMNRDPAGFIPPEKYATLHQGALEACDALDGVKDGVLEDPTRCKFDPGSLLCKGADAPSCLTAPQVEVARTIYAGMKSPGTGRLLFPGLEPGSEMGWSTLGDRKPMALAEETYRYLVYQDENWDYKTFNPDTDLAKADKAAGPVMNSIDPNLKPFFSHGGKLLMYHGWADPGIMPGNSVNYYLSVAGKLGGTRKSMDSIRLFMVPGMGHCRGGDGTDTFDAMAALQHWVAQKQAPDSIPASRVRNGAVDRTRPLCPYPQVAKYKGSGSTDEASNFVCAAP
jgi:feruloyl esterase